MTTSAPAALYLSGMTRSEAINFIQHMPGLTRDEFNELIEEAYKKPETRHAGLSHPGTSKITRKRIKQLVRVVSKSNGCTRGQLMNKTRWNGSIAYTVIHNAEAMGLIEVLRGKGGQSVLRAVK